MANKTSELIDDEPQETILIKNKGDLQLGPRPMPVPKPIKRTKIILEDSDDIPPTGLFLQVNGRAYMIRCGVPVDVPDDVINVLNDARVLVPIKDPLTLKLVGSRERLRFPFRIVK